MIGDPRSIRAFKTLITPENVKLFEDSDRIWNINFVPVRQNQTHHIPDQLKASQSMLSTEVGEEWVGPAGSGKWLAPQCAKRPPSLLSLSVESDILRKYFHVSFHAATDEGTPQKFSPQDTSTKSSQNCFYGLTCQCKQTSLHHNLYKVAFLSEPCYRW